MNEIFQYNAAVLHSQEKTKYGFEDLYHGCAVYSRLRSHLHRRESKLRWVNNIRHNIRALHSVNHSDNDCVQHLQKPHEVVNRRPVRHRRT